MHTGQPCPDKRGKGAVPGSQRPGRSDSKGGPNELGADSYPQVFCLPMPLGECIGDLALVAVDMV